MRQLLEMMAGRLRGPHGQPSKNLHQQHEIHLHQISTVLTAKGRSFEPETSNRRPASSTTSTSPSGQHEFTAAVGHPRHPPVRIPLPSRPGSLEPGHRGSPAAACFVHCGAAPCRQISRRTGDGLPEQFRAGPTPTLAVARPSPPAALRPWPRTTFRRRCTCSRLPATSQTPQQPRAARRRALGRRQQPPNPVPHCRQLPLPVAHRGLPAARKRHSSAS